MCAAALSDPGLRWNALQAELNRQAQTPRQGSPIETTERFLAQLAEDSTTPAATENPGAWAVQVLETARRLAGPGTGRELEALWKKSQFYGELTRASQQLGEQWDLYLAGQLSDLIRMPGHRVAAAEAGLRRLAAFCATSIRAQWEVIEEHYQGMKRLRDDLESAVHACHGGMKMLFGGAGRALRHFIDALTHFTRQRIAQDLLESGVQFYMTLQGRIEDRLRDMDFARQRMKSLTQILATPMSAPRPQAQPYEWGTAQNLDIADPFWEAVQGTAAVQVVLPAGVTDLDESAQQFVQSLLPEHWLALDEWLQKEILGPMGDLLNAATAGSDVANNLGRPLVEQAAVYLGTVLPITDVAQVELAADSPDKGTLEATLRNQIKAAAPPLASVREEMFMLIPETEAGQTFGRTAHENHPGMQCIPVTNPIEVTILREQPEISTEMVDEFFAQARAVYQEIFAVPALSPHGRFDIHEWRPLTPLIKNRPASPRAPSMALSSSDH